MRVASFVLVLIFAACSGSDNSTPACTSGGLNCPCETNAECGTTGEFRCNTLLCKPTKSANVGAACWATADCMEGNYCTLAGRCAAIGAGTIGTACTDDGDCTQDLRCNILGLGARCAPAGQSDLAGNCTKQTDCVAGLFCGGNTCKIFSQAFPPAVNTGDTCANEGDFRAYFEVPRPGQPPRDFYRLPFPNDIRLANGKPDMSDFYRPAQAPFGIDLAEIYLDAQALDFDGYSPVAAVTLRFSQNVDFGTLADGTRLLDLTDHADVGNTFAYTAQRTKWSCENRLSVQPFTGQPMIAGHTYAVVITNAVRSAGGAPPVQDPDLVAVLGASRPADPSLGNAWDVYAPLRAQLGAAVANVATAAVFTVADVPAHMSKVATAVAAETPTLSALTLCSGGGTTPCGSCGPDDAAFTEIHGKIKMPIYQQGTAPYLTAGGNIMESGASAAKARDEDVCFALTLPKGSTMPGGGWPLVVFAHGTGGTFRDSITNGVAAAVAGAGGATFSFEAVGHGMRRGGSATDPADIVYNVLNPRAARDVWLQGAADVLTALKVANLTVAVPSGPTADFDAAKLVLFGHSQGATSGELALPFTTAVSAVILSGAGANLGEALAGKRKPFDVPETLRAVLLGDTIDALHPVAILLQGHFDRSDPFATAPSIGGKHIYMSWGTTDNFSPLATLEYNALALGLRPVAPLLEQIDADNNSLGTPISRPNITVPAVFQYSSGGEGHFVAFQNATAKADWLAFITSYWATGSTSIP